MLKGSLSDPFCLGDLSRTHHRTAHLRCCHARHHAEWSSRPFLELRRPSLPLQLPLIMVLLPCPRLRPALRWDLPFALDSGGIRELDDCRHHLRLHYFRCHRCPRSDNALWWETSSNEWSSGIRPLHGRITKSSNRSSRSQDVRGSSSPMGLTILHLIVRRCEAIRRTRTGHRQYGTYGSGNRPVRQRLCEGRTDDPAYLGYVPREIWLDANLLEYGRGVSEIIIERNTADKCSPFTYCYPVIYMARSSSSTYEFPLLGQISMFTTLLVCYYIFDTSMAQKSNFKMQQQGEYKARFAFPTLPWSVIENPTYIETKHGNKLLTSGWWAYARKINYTADWFQSLTWGLTAGFNTPITLFYPIFFLCVLTHRCGRDFKKCARKYGDDWVEYCKVVKWRFFPGIY